jgi:hypothetical protein
MVSKSDSTPYHGIRIAQTTLECLVCFSSCDPNSSKSKSWPMSRSAPRSEVPKKRFLKSTHAALMEVNILFIFFVFLAPLLLLRYF